MISPSAGIAPDLRPIVGPIERAIKNDRVTGLAEVLRDIHRAGHLERPDLFLEPRADHYARKLIWADPADRFVIVAMTWGVGQGSPLHDHDGLWGAEAVVRGVMRETLFEMVERDGERYRFARGEERISPVGSIGVLIPPLEYHDFGNGGDEPARTIHVYGGNLARARTFKAGPDGWWNASEVNLRYDG